MAVTKKIKKNKKNTELERNCTQNGFGLYATMEPFPICYVENNYMYQKLEKISWSSASNAISSHDEAAHLDTFGHLSKRPLQITTNR